MIPQEEADLIEVLNDALGSDGTLSRKLAPVILAGMKKHGWIFQKKGSEEFRVA